MYLTILLPFTTIIVCSLICLDTLKAYISNNMDSDQTAPMEHSGPKVIKLFSCSTQLSIEFQLHIKTIKKRQMKKFPALRLSDVVFIMLVNVKMPTIVNIF